MRTNSLEHVSNVVLDKRVYVYRNLSHRFGGPGNFSVRQSNKVVIHVDRLMLWDCRFLVSERGRQRVLHEQRKNVHAGISGYVLDTWPGVYAKIPILYDPYLHKTFINANTLKPIYFADLVVFNRHRRGAKVHAYNPS
jgi:hypothetical protein